MNTPEQALARYFAYAFAAVQFGATPAAVKRTYGEIEIGEYWYSLARFVLASNPLDGRLADALETPTTKDTP